MNPDAIFFTADLHFGHKLVIENGMRPFRDVDAMDSGLICLWNETVPKKADVFVMGDVSFRPKEATAAILRALNGRKHLVRGNHDYGANKLVLDCFDSVYEHRVLRIEQTKIVLFHYPIASWYAAHHGSWHLHGHSHGSCPPMGRRYDVGVDCNSLRPVSYRELQPIMGMRPIECGDGHKARRKAGEIIRL